MGRGCESDWGWVVVKGKREMTSFPINQKEAPVSPLPPFLQGVDGKRIRCRSTGQAYGGGLSIFFSRAGLRLE